MQWKKWVIGTSVAITVVVPTSLILKVAVSPKPVLMSDKYVLKFADNNLMQRARTGWSSLKVDEKISAANQNYVDKSIQLLNMVLDEYQKQGKNPSWDLQFATLNKSPTSDEINFFQELTKAILSISKGRINFQLLPYSESTFQQSFNFKDMQMTSWYWSPDYNGLGTWLGYNFSRDYLVPNMWPNLASQLNASWKKMTNQNSEKSWKINLAKYIANSEITTTHYSDNELKKITFKIGAISQAVEKKSMSNIGNFQISNHENKKYNIVPTVSDLYNFVTMFNFTNIDSFYATIQNVISAWSMLDENNIVIGTYDTNSDKVLRYSPSNAINLINTLNHNATILPFIGDGPNTKNAKLVRNGANVPDNPNSHTNTRDWFLNSENDKFSFNKNRFTWQSKADPFAQNATPWNPTFSENTAQLSKPIFTNLYSWTTLNNPTNEIINTQLVAEATEKSNSFANDVNKIMHWFSKGGKIPNSENEIRQFIDTNNDMQSINVDKEGKFKIYNVSNLQLKNYNKQNNVELLDAPSNLVIINDNGKLTTTWKFDFKIRPIPWVDINGKEIKNEYLSPRDFYAGWKGYYLSSKYGLSHNDYFIDMLGVDMETTLEYAENLLSNGDRKNEYVNDGSKNWNNFTFFLNNPTLTGEVCKDILSNQYFSALPYSNEKVQNIIKKDSEFIKLNSNGKILKSETFGTNKIYGSGLPSESYKSLWFASPYRVIDCNSASFTLKINEKYFESFSEEEKKTLEYTQFNGYNKEYIVNNDQKKLFNDKQIKIKKIDEINIAYLNYNIKTDFEQFINGSRDIADIPNSEMDKLGKPINGNTNHYENPLIKDIYSPLLSQEIKTNLIPYTTNIYNSTRNHNRLIVYQAINADGKNFDLTQWGVVPDKVDIYGNTISWKPVPLTKNAEKLMLKDKNNSNIPILGDLLPSTKKHIPKQYEELIVDTFNSQAKFEELFDIFIDGKYGKTINGIRVNNSQDILNYSSYIIRNVINNSIDWIGLANVCFPNMNKYPQLSFTPYGVFNTNKKEQTISWKYYSIAWEKPDIIDDSIVKNNNINSATNEISRRTGGILKFKKSDYEKAFINSK